MTANQFVKHVRSEAAKHNVKVRLPRKESVYIGNIPCRGYASPTEVSVATGRPQREWFPVLAHEFCHMQQFVEKAKVSRLADTPYYDCIGATDIFQEWLTGRDFPRRVLHKAYVRSQNIELDCEKRVVKIASELDLPLDIDTYIKEANAYIFFYDVCRRHRVWTKPGALSFTNTDLMQASPNTFLPTSHYSHVEDYPELYRQLILASERLF
jgi:hypothetical protein